MRHNEKKFHCFLFTLAVVLVMAIVAVLVTKRISNQTVQLSPQPNKKRPSMLGSDQRFAILIGVNHYEDQRIANLQYCEADAIDLRSALLDGGYPAKNIYTLIGPSATKENISKAVKSALDRIKKSKKDAVLIFAFSGHGYSGFLCPTDMNSDDVDQGDGTAYGLHTLLSELEATKTELKNTTNGEEEIFPVLFIDACRDNPVHKGEEFILDALKSEISHETVIFSSCRKGEKSCELPHLGHGLFFHHLIEGLRGYNEETVKDGGVSLNGLKNYLWDRTLLYIATHQQIIQNYRSSTRQSVPARDTDFNEELKDNFAQTPIATNDPAEHYFVVQFGHGLSLERLSEQQRRLVVDLIMFPAVNEGWWADEMPWYLPCFRFALAKYYSNPEQSRAYPDVSKILEVRYSGLLQEKLAQKIRDSKVRDPGIVLPPEDRDLFNSMIKWSKDSKRMVCDLQKILSEYEKAYDTLANVDQSQIQQFEFPPRLAVMQHTLAVLNHVLFIQMKKAPRQQDEAFKQGVDAAKDAAVDFYQKAMSSYNRHFNGLPLNAAPNHDRSDLAVKSFRWLCRSDQLRFYHLPAVSSSEQREENLKKWKYYADLILGDNEQPGMNQGEKYFLSYPFVVEFLSTFGEYHAETGNSAEKYFIAATLAANARLPNHPLHAAALEARAWALTDQWELNDAARDFEKAEKIRKGLTEGDDGEHDPLALLYVNYAEHAAATCIRYDIHYRNPSVRRVQKEGIEREFETIGKEAEKLLSEMSDGRWSFSRFRLDARLRSRAANSYGRAADVLLFDHLLSELRTPDDKRLEKCIRYYDKAIRLLEDSPQEESFVTFQKAKRAITQALLCRCDKESFDFCKNINKDKFPELSKQRRAVEAATLIADYLASKSPDNLHEIREFAYVLLKNPRKAELYQRDNMDINFLMVEFLLEEEKDKPERIEDILFWSFLLSRFLDKPDVFPYMDRRCGFAVKLLPECYDKDREFFKNMKSKVKAK